jgi:hypothetical protein
MMYKTKIAMKMPPAAENRPQAAGSSSGALSPAQKNL